MFDPWPELEAYADSIDLAAVEEVVHQHVPYVVLLMKAIKKWKAEHNNVMPKNFAEKKEFIWPWRGGALDSLLRLATYNGYETPSTFCPMGLRGK